MDANNLKIGSPVIIWKGEGIFGIEYVKSIHKTILKTAESTYDLEYPQWEREFNEQFPKRVVRAITEADLLEIAMWDYHRNEKHKRLIDFMIGCMKRDKDGETYEPAVIHDDHIEVTLRGRRYKVIEDTAT